MLFMNKMIQAMSLDKRPPTIYALLESLVNYDKEDKTKIKNLAKEGRTLIFDFEYPLTNKISKEKFETMILNNFLTRRIGFETFTAFQIALDVKLNEIMPVYNKMFDSLENWNLFEDGEKTIHKSSSDRSTKQDSTNTLDNETNSHSENESDRRFSELPQNEIQNVKDGAYMTEYNLDNNKTDSRDVATSTGIVDALTIDKNNIIEETLRTPADKIAIYKEFQENIKNIYTLIFKDLDCLFYQLI